MNIICFCPRYPKSRFSSAAFVEALDVARHIDVHRQLDSFAEALRHINIDPSIAFLVVPNRTALRQLVTLRELLSEIRVVLILPDRDPQTIVLGHQLRPRYVGFRDSQPGDVLAVINRLLQVGNDARVASADTMRTGRGER